MSLDDWAEMAEGDAFHAQVARSKRVANDFLLIVRLANFAFTRYADGEEWLQQRFTDDLIESAVAINHLASQGAFNVARREMRFLLEVAVKLVYIDQQVPGSTPVQERLALFDDGSVPRSSVSPIDKMVVRMLRDQHGFAGAVKSLFGKLSGYVHPSRSQASERLRKTSAGEFIGFESASTLEAFNRLQFQAYDIITTLLLEGIGPGFTGDLFVNDLDDRPSWAFHKGPFVSEVSAHFNYKAERQRPRT